MQPPQLQPAAVPSLLEILAKLSPAETQVVLSPAEAAVVLRHLAVPAWEIRARRLAERDAAIREARRFFNRVWPSTAATELAQALARYHAATWGHEKHLPELPPGSDERRIALHRILRLNDGKPLRWRRILDVFNGAAR